MRVKICGITNVADARAAIDAGADAIGLNMVAGPRQIDLRRAAEIVECLSPFICPVVLVRLENGRLSAEVANWLKTSPVSHLQVYGPVRADDVIGLRAEGFAVMPVIAVKEDIFPLISADGPDMATIQQSAAIVLDTFDPQRAGGTGKTFCWGWIKAARDAGRLANWPPIMLAGGLRADNVAEAIRIAQPFAVDVSSSVEIDGSPGKKDPHKMQAFVRAAKSAEV